uniref:Pentacotripeptide-repeat region of PRORP domain-containing protein n=1 Tax=Opuntia streptacantha TaxID=393608 RepID=A0A7C9A4S4_OPUST
MNMNPIPLSHQLRQPPCGSMIFTQHVAKLPFAERKRVDVSRTNLKVHLNTVICQRKTPKYLRHPRRNKLPDDSGIVVLRKPESEVKDHFEADVSGDLVDGVAINDESNDESGQEDESLVWQADEVEAISSLFQGRVPQRPGKLNRERPLPLPLPHKIRPLGLPTVKRHVRASTSPAVCSRLSVSQQIYKDPLFLMNLAREIRTLPAGENVSSVLNKCSRFLRKGSLSLTIRELGHMGLPERALQTFCWAQKQPHLFPDDRILSATVEMLARTHQLKLPFNLEKSISLASRGVLEALARGFIEGGSLSLAWKLLSTARKANRVLDSSIYAKLILELGKNPDRDSFVVSLLGKLSEHDSLNLSLQDCTGIMKVCIKLQKFEFVEYLFDWFRNSGNKPSVVMYTTVIHSRYSAKKYRDGLALIWEMESLGCLLDQPAYRVMIKLFVALDDIPRAMRYFSKMKDEGFSPTYDLYREMIYMYLLSGRLAKCKEICKELESAGFKLEGGLASRLLQLERSVG